MYKVLDNVTKGSVPRDPDDGWRAVNIHISLWFMATLSDDLYRLVQAHDGLACTTWVRIHRFFLDKQSTQYLFLSKALRTTTRGDMSIAAYASRLQSIADDLDAIGRPVDDQDLALQFVDGFGRRYKLQAEILKTAMPSFADATSRMQLAEASGDDDNGAQVYAAHHSGPASTNGGRGGGQGGQQPRVLRVSPNYRGKNPIPGFVHGGGQGGPQQHEGGHHQGRRGRGSQGHSSAGTRDYGGRGGGNASHQQPWLGYFAPVGAPFPPTRPSWMPPNVAGVLGPRPGPHSQAYPVMYSTHTSPPPYSGPPPSAPPYSFDHAAMIHATMSKGQYQQQPEWIMDSGASSHCDNGGEFLTSALRDFFANHGVSFSLSCPHTSPKNGKDVRLLRTTNGIIRTLLIHANPPPFWVEGLHTATHLLNLRPSCVISHNTSHFLLYGVPPDYDHLRVFGCLCYPNLHATHRNHHTLPHTHTPDSLAHQQLHDPIICLVCRAAHTRPAIALMGFVA
ncbi:hypothetical protein QYE76_007793 [Lolium multiflorum]|uniref:Integrase catalytic domain-containing protein n=1 Tax=Lolium multiflorum TaxID=4521 RepID=A0AAD8UZ57_LOLMU|nr:hypothetical protein QYE76_007793 [Lolium multiflorum]